MDHEFLPINPPRPLSSQEKGVLYRLLSVDFQGRDELLMQAHSARVIEECKECRSIVILVDKLPEHIANVRRRVPIHAETADLDGVMMRVLLHVVQGFIYEMEIFRADLQNVKGIPKPDSLEFIDVDDGH